MKKKREPNKYIKFANGHTPDGKKIRAKIKEMLKKQCKTPKGREILEENRFINKLMSIAWKNKKDKKAKYESDDDSD